MDTDGESSPAAREAAATTLATAEEMDADREGSPAAEGAAVSAPAAVGEAAAAGSSSDYDSDSEGSAGSAGELEREMDKIQQALRLAQEESVAEILVGGPRCKGGKQIRSAQAGPG